MYSTEPHLVDTANIAAMFAARNKGVAVTESLYELMKQQGVDIPVTNVVNMCGFDSSDNTFTVNQWISENMVEGSSKEAVFCLKPTGRDGGGGLPAGGPSRRPVGCHFRARGRRAGEKNL